ncbi:hypothetical protein GJ496_006440 [Pomphorhynchus laevis]|nr:hypothetical protein GJ496_006440 [Pomphorhynchus laevis]
MKYKPSYGKQDDFFTQYFITPYRKWAMRKDQWNKQSQTVQYNQSTISSTPWYVRIRYLDKRKSTVSTCDLTSPEYDDMENSLYGNHADVSDSDCKFGQPSIPDIDHKNTHGQSSTKLSQN